MQKKRLTRLFYGTWFVFTLAQAAFTGLSHDEAYYWTYSQNLAWGYFDHPPMIAWLISWGYSLLPITLGIRLLPVTLNLGTLILIQKLVAPRDLRLYFCLVSSVLVLQLAGFIAYPDNPLLFFAILFLLLYREYTNHISLGVVLALSFTVAALLYSKYHGILVIFFTAISSRQLWKKPSFYAIAGLGFILYLPHLYWQYTHDFITFTFQLFGRSSQGFKIENILNYILGQALWPGPFMGFLLYYVAFAYRIQYSWEKALRYNLWGFLIFFGLMSFRGQVETNWAVSNFIPLIYFGYHSFENHKHLQAWTYRLLPVHILLSLVFRIFLVWDYPAQTLGIRTEVHAWSNWASQVHQVAQDTPLVFINNYQLASKYRFYAQAEASSMNNVWYGKKTQYAFYDYERAYQGKKVWVIPNWEAPEAQVLDIAPEPLRYIPVENFRSYSHLTIKSQEHELQGNPGKELSIHIKVSGPREEKDLIDINPALVSRLSMAIYQGRKLLDLKVFDITLKEVYNKPNWVKVSFTAPAKAGKYTIRPALSTDWFPPGLQGERLPLLVRP